MSLTDVCILPSPIQVTVQLIIGVYRIKASTWISALSTTQIFSKISTSTLSSTQTTNRHSTSILIRHTLMVWRLVQERGCNSTLQYPTPALDEVYELTHFAIFSLTPFTVLSFLAFSFSFLVDVLSFLCSAYISFYSAHIITVSDSRCMLRLPCFSISISLSCADIWLSLPLYSLFLVLFLPVISCFL